MADSTPDLLPSAEARADAFGLERQLAERWPPHQWLAGGAVLAVSGGADSMALLRLAGALAREGRERLSVAHFDHRLRPESSADADRVTDASRALGLECSTGVWSEAPRAQSGGLEAHARQARYEFLRQVAESRGARFVATAHTADDQAETILHRIVRGTGLRGLAGIRPRRPLSPTVTLVRPLLEVQRTDLVEYLRAVGQTYCTDATNLDRRRTRNRLRHDLLPLLRDSFNPQVGPALARLGGLAGEAQDALDELGGRLLATATRRRTTGAVELDVSAWEDQPAYLVQVTLRRLWAEQRWPEQGMNARHWRRLVTLTASPAPRGRLSLPHGISARLRRGLLQLEAAGQEPTAPSRE